jgi:hypothetical protein
MSVKKMSLESLFFFLLYTYADWLNPHLCSCACVIDECCIMLVKSLKIIMFISFSCVNSKICMPKKTVWCFGSVFCWLHSGKQTKRYGKTSTCRSFSKKHEHRFSVSHIRLPEEKVKNKTKNVQNPSKSHVYGCFLDHGGSPSYHGFQY